MRNKRTLKDWVIALRPWSFPTSGIPVVATLAYLLFVLSRGEAGTGGLAAADWVNGVLSIVVLMVLHAGGNLVSDYYDHVHKVDLPGGPNGVTWIDSGLFAPREILRYGLFMLAVGALLGLYIVSRSSFEVLWIGALAVALPLLYPWLKAHALGDVDVMLSFAILPALGTCFVVTGSYHPEIIVLCLPYGLLTVSILHANNTRDRANDRRAGLCTLPLLTGWRTACWVYVAEQVLPYLLVLAFVVCGFSSRPSVVCLLLTFVSLPMALRNIRAITAAKTEEEQRIDTLDQQSAQLQLAFGLLYTVGFAVAAIW